MAKGCYIGVGGVAKKIKKGYIGVGGIARKIKKAYIGINGVARVCWSGGELSYYGTASNLSTNVEYTKGTHIGNYGLLAGGTQILSYSPYAKTVTDVNYYTSTLTKGSATALKTARNVGATVSNNSYAFFAGGETSGGSYTNIIDAYNPSLTRSNPTSLYTSAYNNAGCTIGNYILIGSGSGSGSEGSVARKTVNIYDTSLTRTTTQLTTERTYYYGASLSSYGLFIGGSGGAKSVEAFNASLTKTSALSFDKYQGSCTVVGNKCLFNGNSYGFSSSDYTEMCVVTNSLTKQNATALSFASRYGASDSAEGFAVFTGGSNTSNVYNSVANAYDEALTRSIPSNISRGRNYLGASHVSNYILFGGGVYASSGSSYTVATVDVYTIS